MEILENNFATPDNDLHKLYIRLRDRILSIEPDIVKFTQKGNKAAGVRARKGLQQCQKMSKDLKHLTLNKNK